MIGLRPAPRVVVFAGPNGAGKTTHAEHILRALDISTFVNADFIARGLSGQRQAETVAFEAGRIMLKRLRLLAAAQVDFGFESTRSSRSFAPFLQRLRVSGYRVSIFYFSLQDARLATRRVRMRVRLGGHDVPADVVHRRFGRSLVNLLGLYLPLADEWTVFDNSGQDESRTVASCHRGKLLVKDERTWTRLHKQAAVTRNGR